MPDLSPRTGVVAIGRNEGERLVRCLCSLAKFPGPVVYVDSASTDGSQTRAAEWGARVRALDMTRPFTAARARAEGFAELEALDPQLAFVLFIDGDCEVEPGWLAEATRFLADNPRHAVVCGRRRERFPEASPFNQLIDREWNTSVGEADACGGDAVFRCDAYREAGGFDPRMIAGEEPELCTRLRARGWRIMRLDTPMTIHDADMHRFGQWWQRAVRSGMGYAQAWWTTRGRGQPPLYSTEMRRAILWAGALPLTAILLALFVNPWLLALWPLATAAQALRNAVRHGAFAARLAVAGKYAELLGIARFALRQLRGEAGGTVVYK